MKQLTWQLDVEELDIHQRGHDLNSLLEMIIEVARRTDPKTLFAVQMQRLRHQ